MSIEKDLSDAIQALSKRVRALEVRPFGRSNPAVDTGPSIISDLQIGVQCFAVGDRNIRVVTGKLWQELTGLISVAPFDSSLTSTFSMWYKNGSGGWNTILGEQQIRGEYYDNGSGTLASLTDNYYGVYWVMLGYDGTAAILFNSYEYSTLADAQKSSIPVDIPDEYKTDACFVARVIIKKNATEFSELINIYAQTLGYLAPLSELELQYSIMLYDTSLEAIVSFSANANGLNESLNSADSGDVILLPAIDISGDYIVPEGVSLVGMGRAASILSGEITLSDGANLSNLKLVVSGNDDTNAIIGVFAPVIGEAHLHDCSVAPINAGLGGVNAVEVNSSGDLVCHDCFLDGRGVIEGATGYAGYRSPAGSGSLYIEGGMCLGSDPDNPFND